jgi:glutathione S-transferase
MVETTGCLLLVLLMGIVTHQFLGMTSFLSPREITLVYFDIPAKAEPIRLALYIRGIPFNDLRVNGTEWQTMKSKYGEYAQIPVMEVDGQILFQSVNILLYAGTLTGLEAKEIEGVLRMREAILACDDLPNTFIHTFAISNAEERVAARTSLCREGGKTYCQLKRIEGLVGDKEYIAENTLTVADLSVFTYCGMLKCGHFDGFPVDILNSFPKLKTFVNRIAQLPKVQEYYADQKSSWAAGFRPDTSA